MLQMLGRKRAALACLGLEFSGKKGKLGHKTSFSFSGHDRQKRNDYLLGSRRLQKIKSWQIITIAIRYRLRTQMSSYSRVHVSQDFTSLYVLLLVFCIQYVILFETWKSVGSVSFLYVVSLRFVVQLCKLKICHNSTILQNCIEKKTTLKKMSNKTQGPVLSLNQVVKSDLKFLFTW